MQSWTWKRSSCGNPCRSANASTASATRSSSPAVAADGQAEDSGRVRGTVRGRLARVDVAGRGAAMRNLAQRGPGARVAAHERVQRRHVDCGSKRVLCAPGRPAQFPVLQDEPLDRGRQVDHQRHVPQGVERPGLLRKAQMPVENGIGNNVLADQGEDVHRRIRILRRKPRSTKQGGQGFASYPVFIEPVSHPAQSAQQGEVARIWRLGKAPQRAHRVREVTHFAAAVRTLQDGVAVGEAAEQEQRLGVLDRRLDHRPAHELVDPATIGRRLGDQVRAPAGVFLDRELLELELLRMGERKVDPVALDDVVVGELPPALARLQGQRGGKGIIRVGERRAAIDAARELVEDDQLCQQAFRRVPDRVAEEAVQSFAVHLLAPLALRPNNVRILGASCEWSDPPSQHPLVPVPARSIGRCSQSTEPEIQHCLGGSVRNTNVGGGCHGKGSG